jgi:hypothetical protein
VLRPAEPPSVSTAPEERSALASPANGTVITPEPVAMTEQRTETVVAPSDIDTAGKNSIQKKPLGTPGAVKYPEAAANAALPVKPPAVATEPVKGPTFPALDLSSLQQRLRDTHAIGVFTKLSLKNQVDDLLAQFRAYYRGTLQVPLAELRQRYDLLLLKVLTLLQDGDPPLAATVMASKEAIWGILADPAKFASL